MIRNRFARVILPILLFLPFLLESLSAGQIHQSKKFINFNNLGKNNVPSEDYSGYAALRRWANFQGLQLNPDNGAFGIKDGICRMIPPGGLSFQMYIQANQHYKATLYLDLTNYQNINNYDYPPRHLKIYINRHLKKIVYFHRDKHTTNPVVIPLDIIDYADGIIIVRLEPGTTMGRFWGIWDAFYTYQGQNE